MKIVTVVGARPQFIKAAAVSREIAKYPEIKEVIIHTGQHFDENMSDIFFEEMQIPRPDYNLNINSISHGAMTGRMLEKIEAVLLKELPEYVLVYGDTNSTIAGALAAKKAHVKVVHVEAGLRSFNIWMPEEINRVLTDRISDILCCPTDKAIDNLKKEGFSNFTSKIVKTGDVMQDAAMFYTRFSTEKSTIIQSLGLRDKAFVLCTVHRAENTDNPHQMRRIIKALNEIYRKMTVIFPLHPRTRKILANLNEKLNFEPVEPVGYFDMLELLKGTKIVLTDSGGMQKEAYFFRKPCVTLRNETEWVELVERGCNCLAGSSTETILSTFDSMLQYEFAVDDDLYGGGNASSKVIQSLC